MLLIVFLWILTFYANHSEVAVGLKTELLLCEKLKEQNQRAVSLD